jgi:hypothetical protein
LLCVASIIAEQFDIAWYTRLTFEMLSRSFCLVCSFFTVF